MAGKTYEELYGPIIRGEITATEEMFEAVKVWFTPPQAVLKTENLKWVVGRTVDEVKAELDKPKEELSLAPTGGPTFSVYQCGKEDIYVFEYDGRTFTYHDIKA